MLRYTDFRTVIEHNSMLFSMLWANKAEFECLRIISANESFLYWIFPSACGIVLLRKE